MGGLRTRSKRDAQKDVVPVKQSKHLTTCGIDPGEKGAIAFDSPDGPFVYDMPMVQTNGKLKYVDGMALSSLFLLHRPTIIVIERVASMPGQGVSTTFQFGVNFGGALSVALTWPCELLLIGPSQWKKKMGIAVGSGKVASGKKALQHYPDMKPSLYGPRGGLKDGRAEGLLLAKYAKLYTTR